MAEIKIKTTDGNNAVTLAGPASGADVTLKLPTAAGSAGQYLKTDGSNGQLSFATVSSPVTALNNATANELVTVGSTTTELDAEANLTFDGTELTLAANRSNTAGTGHISIAPGDTTSIWTIRHDSTGNDLWFDRGTSSSSTAYVGFSADGNIKLTSGKGIDFSATADGTGANQAEVLKDYEEGSWTPTISSGGTAISGSNNRYVRVGGLVYLSYNLESITNEDSGTLTLQGMPFTPANGGKGPCASHSIDSGHSGYITAYCDTSGNLRFLESDTNNANWANISGNEVQPGYLAFTLTYYTTI